tara:strand:+ start:219 stop:428 length:210 start_codon:yes stop_codon:yes gene_type:complete
MDKLFENKTFFENMKRVVEVSQDRGCWKPNEMTAVGEVWSDLEKILKYIKENNHTDGTKDNKIIGDTIE